jgi:hypothetical protein
LEKLYLKNFLNKKNSQHCSPMPKILFKIHGEKEWKMIMEEFVVSKKLLINDQCLR